MIVASAVPVHYTVPSGAFLPDVPRALSEHPRVPAERQVCMLPSYPTSNLTTLRSAAILFLKQTRHKHERAADGLRLEGLGWFSTEG